MLAGEIKEFLKRNGIMCREQVCSGQPVLFVDALERCVVPWPVNAVTVHQAVSVAEEMQSLMMSLAEKGISPVIVTEDRWYRQPEMIRCRILAHLNVFSPIYARNCEIRKIDKQTAADFLNDNHSYGNAACRYRYGMYLKRHTGRFAGSGTVKPGTLVAVATFSNARKWIKGDVSVRSYEWTRYASLPDVRVSGGMGKLLSSFIEDVMPDDIMTYADLEWSEGKVYEQLGFVLEGRKEPVMFGVDEDWGRFPVKPGMTEGPVGMIPDRFFQNLGSNKYRLKLTQYE